MPTSTCFRFGACSTCFRGAEAAEALSTSSSRGYADAARRRAGGRGGTGRGAAAVRLTARARWRAAPPQPSVRIAHAPRGREGGSTGSAGSTDAARRQISRQAAKGRQSDLWGKGTPRALTFRCIASVSGSRMIKLRERYVVSRREVNVSSALELQSQALNCERWGRGREAGRAFTRARGGELETDQAEDACRPLGADPASSATGPIAGCPRRR